MNDERKILVELKNANAAYDDVLVLKDVNIKIREKDFIGVIGPNGGGKTTLIKLILGLLKPVSGDVKYATSNNSDDELSLGYLPQINSIDNKFPISVKDIILSGMMRKKRLISSFSRSEKLKANKIMEEMGILELKNKTMGELSGGQMQRVFLGRAVISSPKLLILDEPNTYVDNMFESELYGKLSILNDSMAIIIVSHDVGMISTYIKSIACVNRNLHYHMSNVISDEQLREYNCPIQLITHGDVPHTVLGQHDHS